MKATASAPLSLRPEHQILLQALSRKAGGVDYLRVALSSGVDEQVLLQEARRHAIFPSLYQRLVEAGLKQANPALFQGLRELYRLNARRSLRLVRELLKILAFLEGQGITAVPFKGPVLAVVAYGDLARRYFVDLDILVAPGDARRAKDLLLARGYQLSPPLSPAQERTLLRHFFEFSLALPRLTMVEIHWNVTRLFLSRVPTPAEALARQIWVELVGKRVPSLAPEDLLLVLCLHGLSHLWFTLGMINDVASLWEAQGPWDWGRLWQQATESGLQRVLLLGLALAQELLGAELPEEVRRRIEADPVVPALCQEAAAKLFTRTGTQLGFGERLRFQLKARERRRDKLRYLWISLTYPNWEDWHWLPLPDRLYWLYYVLRPVRLLLQRVILPLARRLITFREARSPVA